MSRLALFAVLIFFLLTTLSPGLTAAQTEDPRIPTLSSFLEKRVETIDSWQRECRWILTLTLAVIFLGAVASALQIPKEQTGLLRSLTAVVGILIVCLGSVKEQVFEIDRHALATAARQAEKLAEDAQILIDDMALIDEPSSRDEMIDLFKDTLKQIDGIEETLASPRIAALDPVTPAGGFLLAAPAHASEPARLPKWISQPPASDAYVYFVGTAHSPSLTDAKRLSFERAREDAASRFALGMESEHPDRSTRRALVEKLIETAEVEDSHYALDRETKTFRYDTLIRISRKAIARTVEFHALEQKGAIGKQLLDSLQRVEGSSAAYRSRRSQADDLLLAEAQAQLTAEPFQLFQRAMAETRSGAPDAAREVLVELVSQHADFYLGWRELARVSTKTRDVDTALAAFERAVALEDGLPERDPSLHVIFGRFFLDLGELEAARERFEMALSLEPEDTQARLGLLEVERALGE